MHQLQEQIINQDLKAKSYDAMPGFHPQQANSWSSEATSNTTNDWPS